jgi:hypothetical protein
MSMLFILCRAVRSRKDGEKVRMDGSRCELIAFSSLCYAVIIGFNNLRSVNLSTVIDPWVTVGSRESNNNKQVP